MYLPHVKHNVLFEKMGGGLRGSMNWNFKLAITRFQRDHVAEFSLASICTTNNNNPHLKTELIKMTKDTSRNMKK